jgi:hypothetical protein
LGTADYRFGVKPVTSSLRVDFSTYDTNATGTRMFTQEIPVGTAAQVLNFNLTNAEDAALTGIVDVFGYLTDTSGVPQPNIFGPA